MREEELGRRRGGGEDDMRGEEEGRCLQAFCIRRVPPPRLGEECLGLIQTQLPELLQIWPQISTFGLTLASAPGLPPWLWYSDQVTLLHSRQRCSPAHTLGLSSPLYGLIWSQSEPAGVHFKRAG